MSIIIIIIIPNLYSANFKQMLRSAQSMIQHVTYTHHVTSDLYLAYIITFIRGVPRIWQGGPRIFFPRFGNLHVAKRHAAHGESRHARGFGGMPPEKFFLKWCNLVGFGVCFDQILSLKNFKNYHFLYKNFKNCNFIYERINILDTRLLLGNNYSREEIF